MNRIKAVQRALDARRSRVYLEIGVSRGHAFRRIKADEKIAVDPVFRLSARTRRRADAGGVTHYFETTSDQFFKEQAVFLTELGVDVALVDGLHTCRQALRDVQNTLAFLRADGVIVMHDCNPANASVGYPGESLEDFFAHQNRWDQLRSLTLNAWSGDVWKAVVSLRTREDVRVATLKCDFGLALVRKGTPESRLSYTPRQIAALTYADLAADRERLLNLRAPGYLGGFLR